MRRARELSIASAPCLTAWQTRLGAEGSAAASQSTSDMLRRTSIASTLPSASTKRARSEATCSRSPAGQDWRQEAGIGPSWPPLAFS